MRIAILPTILLLCLTLNSAAQVKMVADIQPGKNGSQPFGFTLFNNALCFFANNDNHFRLYQYYKGAVGEVAKGWTNSGCKQPGVLNSKLYYNFDDSTGTGVELTMWDGGNAPVKITDIDTGALGSYSDHFVTLNGKLYFTAMDTSAGMGLYEYNPGNNVCKLAADLTPAKSSEIVLDVVAFKNKILVSGGDANTKPELYEYDPATGQTKLIDINSGAGGAEPFSFTVLNGTLYFSASDTFYGRELYGYDGSAAPQRLTDIAPSEKNGLQYAPLQSMMAAYKGRLYFPGGINGSSYQLWYYDPATKNAGVADVGKNPAFFTLYHNRLYYSTEVVSKMLLTRFDGTTAKVVEQNVQVSGPMAVYNDSIFLPGVVTYPDVELYQYGDSADIIDDFPVFNTVQLYPNPAKDVVTLSLNSKQPAQFVVQITDVAGRIVYNEPRNVPSGTFDFVIDVHKLAAGNYVLTLGSDEQLAWKGKLVVER